MPTILYLFGIRFHFFSREHEPIHIHLQKGDAVAKYEIEEDVKLIYNKGFKKQELSLAESIIEENKILLIEEWNKYHK